MFVLGLLIAGTAETMPADRRPAGAGPGWRRPDRGPLCRDGPGLSSRTAPEDLRRILCRVGRSGRPRTRAVRGTCPALNRNASPVSTAGWAGRACCVGPEPVRPGAGHRRSAGGGCRHRGAGVRPLVPRGTLTARCGVPSVAAFFGTEVYLPYLLLERYEFSPTFAGLTLIGGGWRGPSAPVSRAGSGHA
jgi:hypothetical protein